MVLHYEDPSLGYLSQGLGNLLSPLTQALKQEQQQRRDDRISQQLASQMSPEDDGMTLLTKILNTPEALDLVNRNSNVFQRALASVSPEKQNPLSQMLYEKILNGNNEDGEDFNFIQAAMLSGDSNLQSLAKMLHQDNQDYQKRSFDINKSLYDEIEGTRKNLPNQKIALSRIEDALNSGGINRFRDHFFKALGLDPLRSSASQILEAANKEFFMGDLKQLSGGRINQFLERTLLSALPKSGYSAEANKEIVATLKAVQDIREEKLRLFDEISNQFAKKGKELPRNISSIIEKRLEKYGNEKIKELEDYRKDLIGLDTGTKYKVVSPEGDIYYVTKSQLKQAVDAGGKFINR